MKKKKNSKVVEEILRYQFHKLLYVFERDGRFTIMTVFSSSTGNFVGTGYAFCSREDRYSLETGCHMALNRFLTNTNATKTVKHIVHEDLDERLEAIYLKKILIRLLEEENERIN